MARMCDNLFTILFLGLTLYQILDAYNLSPKPNVVFTEPKLNTFMPKTQSSYFGYSLNLRSKGIIIGAPRAQSSLETQKLINETGVIYRCSIFTKQSCYPYVIDSKGNKYDTSNYYIYDSEKRDHQWLGAAMDGGISDNDKLLICAPRFVAPIPTDYLMHGVCYWMPNTLSDQPANITQISPLLLISEQVKVINGKSVYYYIFAEQGLSAHVTPNNEEFLIGAPGLNTWKGSVIHYWKTGEVNNPQQSRRALSDENRYKRDVPADDEFLKNTYRSDVPKPENWNQPDDSYFGYAVTSGYFDSANPKKLLYVATAPQANSQSGEAYLFSSTNDLIEKYYVFRGSQFGEYFGYSALAEDINGDGLTDVIISAPQYSSSGSFEDGAIYVFMNMGRYNFERKAIIAPTQGQARFGSTLSSLGDINHDGFNDIAVGAPFANNGSVFVYLGNKKGLHDLPSQRLDSPIVNLNAYGQHMFGHGLSKGSDIDNNGFNDLAIGAPNAELVFLYRAYPVVKILATITSEPREISTEQKTIKISICYAITTNSTQVKSHELSFSVILDPQFKRLKIRQTQSNVLNFNTTATLTQQCRILECDVIYKMTDIFKPIEMEMHYEIVKGVPQSEEFCSDCVAVDPADPKMSNAKIIFNTGCASDICVADLQIKSSLTTHTYILGSSRTFAVTYAVTNVGETAYLPQINITSSNHMPLNKVPSNCIWNNNYLLCDLNMGQPLPNQAHDRITVVYDVADIKGDSVTLNAVVFSTGKEKNPADNIVKDDIMLQKFTEIDIVGEPKGAEISLDKAKSNFAEIENIYEIKSVGPSAVDTLEIIFNIPTAYKVLGSDNKLMQIINSQNISMQAVYDSQIVGIELFENKTQLIMGALEITKTTNLVSYPKGGSNGMYYDAVRMGHVNEVHHIEHSPTDPVLSASMSRRRREAATQTISKEQYSRISAYENHALLSEEIQGTLPINRTIVFNCNNPNITACVQAKMSVPFFKPHTPVTISLKFTVDLKEINNVLSDVWEFFVILIDVNVKRDGDTKGDTLAINRKIKYNIISKYVLHRTPIWIIILAVLGGILVLAAITYGLYKAGFFKRSMHDELTQAKLETNVELENLNK